MAPQIFTELEKIEDLKAELENNPGLVIIKFGATWCAPCKRSESHVKSHMSKLPQNCKCFVLDIDESLDIYAFFKTKRLVNGIPALISWVKGNTNSIPNNTVCSSDPAQIDAFFVKSLDMLRDIEQCGR